MLHRKNLDELKKDITSASNTKLLAWILLETESIIGADWNGN